MNHKAWMDRTPDGTFGKRSAELQRVDVALDTYHKNGKQRLDLYRLNDALGDWKLSKRRQASRWRRERNYGHTKRADAVGALTEFIHDELNSIYQGQWVMGGLQHCYAYAMNDLNPGMSPTGGHCNPRNFADFAAERNQTPPPVQPALDGVRGAKDRYVQGVIDDGAAQNKVIALVGHRGVAQPAPPALGGGRYLVAMIANPAGFHFMRRDDQGDMTWTHKNGADSEVCCCFYDTITERYRLLSNGLVAQILSSPQDIITKLGCNMVFEAYFSVPTGGIKVGRKE